mmetsp:Transcript_25858/g.25124  ORF Transcript_25858/g.25124 Transcript_25858/m.25124 type:complete len:154 (-) Transcript_25858:77-538(-)|eukprot:CAMPEP_0170566170 /NCGR_PEP_ID=MMETSP0211-20121228/79666_1 /TAXON_ID=311385 /ORGANISM="Pseudokeronopsis sp., Strain OXSARD2" /LENGTH=153 /DNA_ID=CAMNT_0010887267 /DNA_START=722 /DNA_END=1183 /DNA_ORIENTATION=-
MLKCEPKLEEGQVDRKATLSEGLSMQMEALKAKISKNIIQEIDNEEIAKKNFQRMFNLKLNHFTMIRQIGQGHFGKIMLAKYTPPFNLEDDQIMARIPLKLDQYSLKMIKMSVIHKDKQIEHLKNEKAVLTKISETSHPLKLSNMFLSSYGTF